MAFHLRHPSHGDILIDTGFDRSFHDHPRYGNLSVTMRAYAALQHVEYTQIPDGIDLGSRLEQHQIDPTHVFLTHLHADHTGGLSATPSECHVYCGKRERTLLSRLVGNHLRGRPSIRLLDTDALQTLLSFSHVLDVFGDAACAAPEL